MDQYPHLIQQGNTIIFRFGGRTIIADPSSNVDVGRTPDLILISHAHSDHISKLSSVYKPGVKVVMSPATYRILRFQGFSIRDSDVLLLRPGENLEFGSIRITARNAGHVIGSLMFELDFGRVVIGFTGDFNFEGSNVIPPADIMDVDILLLDATYGKPIYSFPPRKILYRIMQEKLKILLEEDDVELILKGYALGKGQELTKFAWDKLRTQPCVDAKVAFYNKVYEEIKKERLGEYSIGTKSRVYIRSMRSKKSGRKVKKVVFTGWVAVGGVTGDRLGFPLSSHNSFTKLVDYVVRSAPDAVYVAYGYKDDFSSFLVKELGVPAKPIPNTWEELRPRIKIIRRF